MSSPGSIPWAKRFMARVTTSTLPVRSPLPKSVPSTRSAPASTPSSAAATAQPRSLCGWRDRMTRSRREILAEEPLDRVGVEVGRVHLHGGGEVQDDLPLRRGLDDVHHRLADLHGEVTSVPV